jgi:hypothetical protein
MATTTIQRTKGAPVWGELDIRAAFAACDSSAEELRECVVACRRSARRMLDAQIGEALAQRGCDALDLCAGELAASLADIGVYDLLLPIAMGRKDAIIYVYSGSLESRVWCSAGEIIDAQSGRLEGAPAVYRILALEDGELVADFRPVRRRRTMVGSTQALMLEAMRRKDESRELVKRLGGLERVYASTPNARDAFAARHLEFELLEAFDGGSRIDAVLARSAGDDLIVLQAVWRLVELGCLIGTDGAADLAPQPTAVTARASAGTADIPRAWAIRSAAAWQVFAALVIFGIALVFFAWKLGATAEPEVSVHTTQMPAADAQAPTKPTPKPGSLLEPETQEGGPVTTAYPLDVTVQPERAELWLDGEPIGIGRLFIVLARDGRTHELRVSAADHRPQTFLFADNSPPRAIILEPVLAGDQAHPAADPARPRSHSGVRLPSNSPRAPGNSTALVRSRPMPAH